MSASSADSLSRPPSLVRLPPNPRRRRVPVDQRKRVIRACNPCNVRRIKCSGDKPCTQCATGSRACEYPPEAAKPKNLEHKFKELEAKCSLLERCLADLVPSERDREALVSKLKAAPTMNISSSNNIYREEDEQDKTDGRILQDPEGHARYLGESSGAAFIDRLREFVAKALPLLPDDSGLSFTSAEAVFTSLLGRYHTHDSKPLILPEVDPFHIPEAAEIRKLLAAFRFYSQDGIEGGIYFWGDLWELEEQAIRHIESAGPGNDTHFLANLNAILALACQHDPSLAPSWDVYPGETYFARAKLLLINPIEDAKLSNMRILCLMAHYLMGVYRRDAAYLYVGLAGKVSVIHGLHKGWMIDGQGSAGEVVKRDFWNTFIFDRWLSCLMGRPAIIPEQAVDVSYPVELQNSNLPPAMGLRAHAKLSVIMDQIVLKLYGHNNTERSISEIAPVADNLIQKLNNWMEELPHSLRFGCDVESDRSCLILHLIFNQLMILCSRPFLFVAAKQAVAAKYITTRRPQSPSNLYFMGCCATAARRNTQLSRRLLASNQTSFFSTHDYHHAFTAAIVLLLVRLLPEITSEDDQENVSFLQNYLCKAGEKGNESATDCASMVLEFGAVVDTLLVHTRTRSSCAIPGVGHVNIMKQNSDPLLSTPADGGQFGSMASLPADMNFDIQVDTDLAPIQELYAWFDDPSY